MLRSRLTALGSSLAVLVLAGGCSEGGALEENVVRPGITAMQQASELTCSSNASALRTAMEAYELLEGAPAPDEDALIAGQYLRDESALWDIVDGQLVPVDPGCGSVPTEPVDTVEIVTTSEPPQSADEMFDGFSDEQVAAAGGEQCARELAAIFSGAARYVAELGIEPSDLQQIVDDDYLDELPTLWQLVDDELVPSGDAGCSPLG